MVEPKSSKLYIITLDSSGNDAGKIEAMFNPTEYSIDKSNQFQSTPIIGLTTPLTQFVNGNAATMALDFMFDTYTYNKNGTPESVTGYTDKMMKLITIDEHLHAPPVCRIVWGKLEFKATVEKVTRKFTMFLEDGTPVRATVNVAFKEYQTISNQLKQPLSSSDRSKVHILKAGESLSSIAGKEYGDPGQWRKIAEKNNITNPLKLESGKEIIIPPR